MPRISKADRKKKEKAQKERKRREERSRQQEQADEDCSGGHRRRGRPSIQGGAQAPSPALEAPDAINAPSLFPIHTTSILHNQTPKSSQGCANSASGGVMTQEQSLGVTGLRLRSVPPSISPTSRRGPSCDSHGHMDVDMESYNAQTINSENNHTTEVSGASRLPSAHRPHYHHSTQRERLHQSGLH